MLVATIPEDGHINDEIKPEYRVFAIDDTEYWNLPDLPETSKILSVYLYNKSENSYCCEIMASYECHKIYSILDDESIEADQYEMLVGMIDYNDNVGDISYYHCSNVDKLKTIAVLGDFDNIKEAIEYARCNYLI